MLAMYSPALLPSRLRAAAAKKRIWSTIGGISSERVREIGLPVLRTSSSISSSARDSMASAIRNMASERSDGVESRQLERRGRRLHGLVDVGSARDSGAVAYSSPVTGSITGVVAPSAAGTRLPLTKFEKASMVHSYHAGETLTSSAPPTLNP